MQFTRIWSWKQGIEGLNQARETVEQATPFIRFQSPSPSVKKSPVFFGIILIYSWAPVSCSKLILTCGG